MFQVGISTTRVRLKPFWTAVLFAGFSTGHRLLFLENPSQLGNAMFNELLASLRLPW